MLTPMGEAVLLVYSIIVVIYTMLSLFFTNGPKSFKAAVEIALLIPVFIFLTNIQI